MTGVHEGNRAQADMWTAAGPIWVELRDRFDDMAAEHGRAAVAALDPTDGEHVADIGCGAGSVTLELARAVGSEGRVVGVDISPTMIEGARALANERGAGNVDFLVADAMVEPVGSDLDAVYSRFGVMFFSDPVIAFRNLRESLRRGGRTAFTCWQSAAANSWASVPLGVAREYVDIPFGPDPNAPGPFSFADPDRVTGILSDAGFADVTIAARAVDIAVGADHDDAVSFLLGLSPPVRALADTDPDRAAALRRDVMDATADWATPDGVVAPSASWIVTAINPS